MTARKTAQAAETTEEKATVEVEFLEDSFGIQRGQVKKVTPSVADQLVANRHARRK